MTRLLRLAALFVVIALVILGALVRDIRNAQSEHFTTGKTERHTLAVQNDQILRQNREILTLLREGK